MSEQRADDLPPTDDARAKEEARRRVSAEVEALRARIHAKRKTLTKHGL
jgi:hypothetical protein